MLTWSDVIHFATKGNPQPDRRVKKQRRSGEPSSPRNNLGSPEKKVQKQPILAHSAEFTNLGCTTVFVVKHHCSIQTSNLILERVGQALPSLSPKMPLSMNGILHMAWCELRPYAIPAMPIWGMCFLMGPNPVECDTASTQRPWHYKKKKSVKTSSARHFTIRRNNLFSNAIPEQ